MQEQIQQQAAYHQSRAQTQSIDQAVSAAQESKRLSNPADLASMIAARAASRKPMTTSPTRKDFPPLEDRFARSSTMSSDTSNSSLENAR